jgi:NitT/TauT family transport system substrate-binding protein
LLRKVLLYLRMPLLIIAMIVGTGGCNIQLPNQGANSNQIPPDQVTFNLSWLPEDPVFWAALDKGFWAQQNLDVKIIRGYGSADTVTKIATKKAEFGLADMGSLILARAKDENIRVKAIANYQTSFPAVVIYHESRGITKPKDLEGKTIVSSANSAWRLFFPAFAQATGIDQSKVQWKLLDSSLHEGIFLRGEVDAWLEDVEILPSVEQLSGQPVKFFSYKNDAKVDRYAQSIIVNEEIIEEDPDLVRRFLVGYLKGLQFCLENPSEVGEVVKKYVPEIDTDLTIKSWQVALDHEIYASEESRVKGLGWMSRERMEKTIELVYKTYNLKGEMAPEKIYTTEFLPKEPIFPSGK